MKRRFVLSLFVVSTILTLSFVWQFQQLSGKEPLTDDLLIEETQTSFTSMWMTERVASGKTFGNLTDKALAIDSQGHRHVVYGGEQLYYAFYDGSQWHYETVPTPLGSGSWAAVAVDTADNPHIAFYHALDDYPNPDGSLMYAHKSVAGWEVTTVDTTGDAGRRASLAMDNNNRPHISYTKYDGTDTWLQYATLIGGAWQIEAIATGSINNTSIAVDSLNQPHISYSDGSRYIANGAVKYAYKNGSIWQLSSVAACNPGCDYLSSIAIDSQNRPHMAYYSDLDTAVFHSVKNGTTWQSSIVEGSVDHSYGLITKVSISLDQNDTPVIAYVDVESTPLSISHLRLAHLDNSIWMTQTLDQFPWQVLGAYDVSVATAPNGNIHVAYMDNGPSQLKLASIDGSQNVTQAIIDDDYSYFMQNNLEAQNNSSVHLLYAKDDGFSPEYSCSIQHAAYDSTQWTEENIGQGGCRTSMTLDAQGFPHVTFTVINYDSQNSTYAYTLKYGVWNGLSWIITDAVQSTQSLGTPQIQLDAQENPHIVYGSYPPVHAQRINNTWITETIPINDELQHFTIDSTNTYHGVYHDYNRNQSVHAQWGNTAIVTNTIVSPVNNGLSFAVDANNVPHAVYFAGEWLYGTWTGSAWIGESFFSALSSPQSVLSPQGGGGYVSLDLDFGSGNVLHIIYTNGANAVTHFYKENGVWAADDLGFNAEIGLSPIIDVNDDGQPVVVFTGSKSADIFVAWPDWESQVTQAGGHFYVYDTAELIFASNSLDQDINLRFIPQRFTSNTTETIFTFTLESTGLQSTQVANVNNYQLRLNYDEMDLPVGMDERDLRLGYWDGSQWVAVDTAVNTNANQVEATLSSFGTFALMDITALTGGPNSIYLPIVVSPPVLVSAVLTPFDANLNDLGGPSSWANNYGKTPEIIVSSNGVELDVLAQDYNPGTAWSAVLLHIKPTSTGYAVTQSLTNLPMLDRVMGLATDDAGNRYYATGVDESAVIDSSYPPLDTYRSNIVRIIKLNPAGNVQYNIDLDTARYAFNNNAEMIINPMVAASSRLAVGGNEIALVHGINTDPDWNIGGARHQKALSTRLNAANGAVTRTSSIWVSHSFDQRLFYDGAGIIEHHLGDAYPRAIVFGRDHISYPLFHIKGALGENLTATRLGNIALIENDPTYGYIALFATETSPDTGNIFNSKINGPRNLAIVRINSNDNSLDPSLPDTLTVVSAGTQHTNRLRWLTHYSDSSNLHAERPKLIDIGGDQYIVLWEEWLNTGSYSDTFNGVYGMVIDANGNILKTATFITDEYHLHRGDDAFLLNGRAAWITGRAAERKLYIHFVDVSLTYERVTLD